MTTLLNKTSIPIKQDIFDLNLDKCAYCGIKTKKYKSTGKQFCNFSRPWGYIGSERFIYTCSNHLYFAERDVKAYLHLNCRIKILEFMNDPIFSVLPSPLPNDYYLPTNIENDIIFKDEENQWNIILLKQFKNIVIPVIYLKTFLPEYKQPLVDDFINRLNKGFYLSEYNQYLENTK